jgi:hypothetical protein
METVYKPHRYLFAIAKGIPVTTFVGSLLCWVPSLIITLMFFHRLYMPLVRLSLVANLTVFFIALFFSMILHEVCGTTYSISETAIIKKSPYKTALIHFENVIRFGYFQVPLLGGFGFIKVPSGSIMLPFIIERLDACVEDIRQHLSACGKQDAYDAHNIENYKFRAVVNEMSIRRMERTIPALIRIIIGAVAASVLIAHVFWELSFRWILSWTFAGIVFPIIGYLAAEMMLKHIGLRREMQERPSPLPNTPASERAGANDESKIYWSVGAITAVVYAVAGILLKQFSS